MNCLQAEGISVRYGQLQALQDVALTLSQGERHAVIGPNGAGKTTFFNVIAGEVKPTAGRIQLFGRDITALPSFRRTPLGLSRTFQRTRLFPNLSVLDNLVLALQALDPSRMQMLRPRSHYRARQDEAVRQLERVGLAAQARRPAGSLGYGEQRQIEILLALVQHPKLLLLDEPTAGLAPADVHLVTEMLAANEEGTTILLIEHDMEVVFGLVDRVTVLHAGQVVASGTVEEVRSNPMVQEVYLGGKV